MATWRIPITDRILADVRNKTTKGFINNTDLRRIEENTLFLSDDLKGYGYNHNIGIIKPVWSVLDFPTVSQMSRIINNINILIDVFGVFPYTPSMPETFENIDYIKLNNLEQNIQDINTAISNMVQTYSYCGDISSGEV